MIRRKIIDIDESKCNGCGQCVPACAEGALRIIDGKAKLAADTFCDGLGACLGECPQGAIRIIEREAEQFDAAAVDPQEPEPSRLANWPVQLHLVPPHAPFLKEADLLLTADCVPFALPDFHRRFLRGRPLLIGCPKLDDSHAYVEKLAAILRIAAPRSLTVVHMEVPCCLGLLHIAAEAKALAESNIPLHEAIISLRGAVLKSP